MKSGEIKHEMTLFHTMEPIRNILFQRHILFVTIYGLVWSFSVNFQQKMMLVHLKVPYYRALTFSSNGYVRTGIHISFDILVSLLQCPFKLKLAFLIK